MKDLNIHIIGGTGQMGNWLKNFFEAANTKVSVSGRKGVARKTLQDADMVFLSVPISQTKKIIPDIVPFLKKTCLIVDLSSIKTEVNTALEQTNQPALGMHLLFGPTVTTILNQKVIFTQINHDLKINLLKKMLTQEGAEVIEMTTDEHDQTMAYIQNLIHFVNITLGKTFLDGKISADIKATTPAFLSQESALHRVLGQSPTLLTEIQIANPKAKKPINDFIANALLFQTLLEEKNKKTLEEQIILIHKNFTPQKNVQPPTSKKLTTKTAIKFPKESAVAYLGPEGTYSYQAAKQFSDNTNRLLACQSIYAVFDMVEKKKARFGVVPAENTTEGTVRETLDYLIDFDCKVNGSLKMPIHHALLSFGKNLDEITEVFSHPQALGQTKKWLQAHLPLVKITATQSTLSAITEREKNSHEAFIGSAFAAETYKLNILAKDIEDNPNNFTEFYIISKEVNPLRIKNNQTILFLTIFNRVGILRDILNVFATQQISLTNIESRPSREKTWDYHFFVEVAVSLDDPKLFEALNTLKEYCPIIQVLGGTI